MVDTEAKVFKEYAVEKASLVVAPLISNLIMLFELWLISSFARTISIKTLISFFLIGAMLVPFVNLLIQKPAATFLGNDMNSYTLNPIIEESLKIFPLVVLVTRTQTARAMGILDMLLVGAALGGGFGFAEDSIRLLAEPGPSSSLFGGIFGGEPWRLNNLPSALITWPHGGWYGPEVFGYPDHPLLPNGFAETFSSGHLVWSALLGWGIGMALRLKKKVWWILPIFLGAFTMFDHAAFNYVSSQSFFGIGPSIDMLNSLGPIYWLEGFGRLIPILLLGTILVGLVLDCRRLYQGLSMEPGLRLTQEGRKKPYFLAEPWLMAKTLRYGIDRVRDLAWFFKTRREIINLKTAKVTVKSKQEKITAQNLLREEIDPVKHRIDSL
jgi:RsiW-degrading membrane proteinase PrsW (M82 family)